MEAGIASAAVVAVDGTKMAADASGHRNRGHEEIAREILAEAGRIDAAEDELHGDRRGDELPAGLATRGGRKEWIREALRRQKEEREEDPEPVPRDRAERLELCRRRLVDEHRTVVEAHRAYEEAKAEGPRRGRPPVPAEPPAGPEGRVNTTDPDSQKMRSPHGFLQGYNAQAVTNEAAGGDRRRGADRGQRLAGVGADAGAGGRPSSTEAGSDAAPRASCSPTPATDRPTRSTGCAEAGMIPLVAVRRATPGQGPARPLRRRVRLHAPGAADAHRRGDLYRRRLAPR